MSGVYLNVPEGLQLYADADVVSIADIEGARIIMSLASPTHERSVVMWLALALAIRSARDGHSCIDLADIGQWGPSSGSGIEWNLDAQAWKTELALHTDLVCTPESVDATPRRPLVLDGNRLYLARVFAEECAVATRLLTNPAQQLRIILGGPGTGKTTILTLRIANILRLTDTPANGILAITYTDAGVKALAENSAKFTNLQKIGLGNNQITDAGVKAMAENGAKFPNLQ